MAMLNNQTVLTIEIDGRLNDLTPGCWSTAVKVTTWGRSPDVRSYMKVLSHGPSHARSQKFRILLKKDPKFCCESFNKSHWPLNPHINIIFISYSYHIHIIFISYSYHIYIIFISYSYVPLVLLVSQLVPIDWFYIPIKWCSWNGCPSWRQIHIFGGIDFWGRFLKCFGASEKANQCFYFGVSTIRLVV